MWRVALISIAVLSAGAVGAGDSETPLIPVCQTVLDAAAGQNITLQLDVAAPPRGVLRPVGTIHDADLLVTRGEMSYDPTSPYDQKGLSVPRDLSIAAPNEMVDPFSGGLILAHTDLHLPGIGGLDLTVQRVYNSKIHRNYAARASGDPNRIALGMLFVPPSPVGLGWTLHFGRLVGAVSILPNNQLSGPRYYERPDGSQHPFFQYSGEGCGDEVDDICLLSKENDNLYQPGGNWGVATRNGLNVIFGHTAFDGFALVHYATEIRDAQGNRIQIAYLDDEIDIGGTLYHRDYLRHFPDYVIDSAGRQIQFNYGAYDGEVRLASIAANGRLFEYNYSPATQHGQFFLTEARPPAGASWHYDYAGLANGECADNSKRWCELTDIEYPCGATIHYAFDDLVFWAQTNPMAVRAVSQRDIGGRELQPGAWTYTYNRGAAYDGDEHTVITRPDGSKEVYTYFGVGAGPYNPIGLAWKAGALLKKRILDLADAVLEVETFDWVPSQAISDEIWGDPWIGFDLGVHVARMQRHAIERGGLTWVTEHTSFHDNGRPRCTTETGDGAVRYRVNGFSGQSHWQGDLLFRFSDLKVTDALSDQPFPPEACDPDQSTVLQLGPEDEFEVREYNNHGQLLRENLNGRIRDYVYHADGHIRAKIDYRGGDVGEPPFDGVCSGYQSYLYGEPQTIIRGASAPACDNGIYTEQRAVDWFGKRTSETDGRGNTTAFGYDAIGRLTSVVPPGSSGESPVLVTYDGSALAPHTMRRVQQGGSWAESHLDGYGREIERVNVSGVEVRTAYDSLGRLAFQSLPSYQAGSTIGDTYAYDALGRLLGITHADGGSRSFSYGSASHTVTTTDENQRVTIETRQAFGSPDAYRLVRIQQPGEPAPSADNFHYTVGGRLKQVDYAGRQRYIFYNIRKNVFVEFSTETNNLFFGYDAAGNLRCRDRGSSPDRCSDQNLDDTLAQVRYRVDNLGRVTEVLYEDPNTPDITYTYDNANNLLSMIDGVGEHEFVHTSTNRLETRTSEVFGHLYDTEYAYDDRGNRVETTYPSGRTVTYEYDAANRVTRVHDAGANLVSQVDYHANGAVEGMTFGNGVRTTTNLDLRQRPTDLDALGVLALNYAYDAIGNVTSLSETTTGYSAAFDYDSLDRLEDAIGPWGNLHYNYNAQGDRTSEILDGQATTYSYDIFGKLTALTGRLNMNFVSDVFGNTRQRRLTGGIKHLYTYDAENRIRQVAEEIPFGPQDVIQTYAYDGQGRRMIETDVISGESRVIHFDIDGFRIAESTGTGQPTTEYVMFDGRTIAELDIFQRTGDINCDHMIDYDDVMFVADCFAGSGLPPAGDPETCLQADLDGDGDVDCDDDAILRGNLDAGPCAFGDFNCDGQVDTLDFAVFVAAFGGPGVPSPCVSFDANGDGVLDLSDFAALQQSVGQPPGPTKFWAVNASGFWHDPANWSDGAVPGPNDVVLIDRPAGNYMITVSQGANVCASLLCRERLTIAGGTLSVSGTIQVDNQFQLGNGEILDATILPGAAGQGPIPPLDTETQGRLRNVTLLADMTINQSRALRMEDTLTLEGTITLDPGFTSLAARLYLLNGAVLDGTGEIQFSNNCGNCTVFCEGAVIESDIEIRGKSGTVASYLDSAWTNWGTVTATGTASFPYSVRLLGPFTHRNAAVAMNGGGLTMADVVVAPGARIDLGLVGNGSLRLSGADNQIDGTINLRGHIEVDTAATPDGVVHLDGAGEIVFHDHTDPNLNRLFYNTDVFSSLRIGSQVTVRTGTGSGVIWAGSIDPHSMVSLGRILADTPSRIIRTETNHFVNQGSVEVRDGAEFQPVSGRVQFPMLWGTWRNEAAVIVGKGGVFDRGPSFPSPPSAAFEQTATGSLTIELAGTADTDRGRVRLSAPPTFGGTLNIVLIEGYVPPVGTIIELITHPSGQTTGTFANITGLDIGNDTRFEPTYDFSALTLQVVPN